jgi:hypothetical protein
VKVTRLPIGAASFRFCRSDRSRPATYLGAALSRFRHSVIEMKQKVACHHPTDVQVVIVSLPRSRLVALDRGTPLVHSRTDPGRRPRVRYKRLSKGLPIRWPLTLWAHLDATLRHAARSTPAKYVGRSKRLTDAAIEAATKEFEIEDAKRLIA